MSIANLLNQSTLLVAINVWKTKKEEMNIQKYGIFDGKSLIVEILNTLYLFKVINNVVAQCNRAFDLFSGFFKLFGWYRFAG